jgi:hypothetical protein
MTHNVEDGSIFQVLLWFVVIHGVLSVLGSFWWLLMRLGIESMKMSDTRDVVIAKVTWIFQRRFALAFSAANILLFVVYLFMLFSIGTVRRESDDIKVNVSHYGVGFSGCSLILGYCVYTFFWYTSAQNMLIVSTMWIASFGLMGFGALADSGVQRQLMFSIAVVSQAVSLVCHVYFSAALKGPLVGWSGASGTALTVVCFALLDALWYVGYNNHNQSGLRLNGRWKMELAACIVGFVLFTVIPAFYYWAMVPSKKQLDGFAPKGLAGEEPLVNPTSAGSP